MTSGVYKIVNMVTGDCYIGSSINVHRRIKRHKNNLNKGKHENPHLQRAWDKYFPHFRFDILTFKTDYLEHEQKYLDILKPVYNISKSAKAPMLGRKHSPSTLKKFKDRRAPRGKEHYMYGKKWSSDRFKHVRTGFTHSEETKLKMSKTAIKINAISRIDHDKLKKSVKDNLGNIFNSMTEASLFHNISISTVCDILKGRHYKTRKGVSFEYI